MQGLLIRTHRNTMCHAMHVQHHGHGEWHSMLRRIHGLLIQALMRLVVYMKGPSCNACMQHAWFMNGNLLAVGIAEQDRGTFCAGMSRLYEEPHVFFLQRTLQHPSATPNHAT